MPLERSLRRRSPATRRRLALVFAAAEERLMRTHAAAAAGFLREVADDLPFEQALEVYMRLLAVPGAARRNVAVRALALFGEAPPETLAEPAHDSAPGRLGRWTRRLRGRRRERLRGRIEAAIAPAQNALRDAHLAGAADVAQALRGIARPAEAVQLYLDALDIGPGWGERIFHDAVAAAQP